FRPLGGWSGVVGRNAAFVRKCDPLGRNAQSHQEDECQGQAAVDDLILEHRACHDMSSRALIVTCRRARLKACEPSFAAKTVALRPGGNTIPNRGQTVL